SLLALASSTVMVSCTSDPEACNVGWAGDKCDQEVRLDYYNTYRGDASDNHGGTYTDWAIRLSSGGTDVKALKLEILDNVDANKFLFDAMLTSNTTFEITQKTMTIDGVTYAYTGQGTVGANNVSFTLT